MLRQITVEEFREELKARVGQPRRVARNEGILYHSGESLIHLEGFISEGNRICCPEKLAFFIGDEAGYREVCALVKRTETNRTCPDIISVFPSFKSSLAFEGSLWDI